MKPRIVESASSALGVRLADSFPRLGHPRLAPKVVRQPLVGTPGQQPGHREPLAARRTPVPLADYLPPLPKPPGPKPKKFHGLTVGRWVARLKILLT